MFKTLVPSPQIHSCTHKVAEFMTGCKGLEACANEAGSSTNESHIGWLAVKMEEDVYKSCRKYTCGLDHVYQHTCMA